MAAIFYEPVPPWDRADGIEYCGDFRKAIDVCRRLGLRYSIDAYRWEMRIWFNGYERLYREFVAAVNEPVPA